MKKRISLFLALMLLLTLSACGKQEKPADPGSAAQTGSTTAPTAGTTEPTAPPITWMTFPADRDMTAQQYFVYNCETGRFMAISGEEEDRIYPASVTKLFTAYVAGQYVSPDKKITVDEAMDYVYPGSSVAGLKRGDEITARQLVEGMLLPSGNDAAYVLAIEAAGNLSDWDGMGAVEAFVAEMNSQARLLGMTGSHFANPDGIHEDDHYMTYRDLAILGMLSLEDPVIMTYAATASDTVTISGEEKQWKNTNALIHPDSEYYCPHAIGLKTGQTPSAGSCLLSAFEYDGTTLIIGVFGCPEVEDRFADTLQLFNNAVDRLNKK